MIAAAGAVGILILVNVIQQSNTDGTSLFGPPVYQEEARIGMSPIAVNGSEGKVPQKLIDELNKKGD